MYIFGPTSTKRLFHLNPDLSLLCHDVLAHYDISILCTTRDKDDQTEAFNTGSSRARFAESPHNYYKSLAVDVGLWNPTIRNVDYNDIKSFKTITDCFKLHAEARGIEITCGIDFDGFTDLPHIQLTNWKVLSLELPLVD